MTGTYAIAFRYWLAQCELAGGIDGCMLLACTQPPDYERTLPFLLGLPIWVDA